MKKVFAMVFNNKGTALAEMIGAAALFGLFLAFAAGIMVQFTLIFTKVNSMVYDRKVYNIVMESLEGELEKAQPIGLDGERPFIFIDILKNEGESDSIVFTGKDNIKVMAYVNEEGRLAFEYLNGENGSKEQSFGKEVYGECVIEDLKFSLPKDDRQELIYIEMNVKCGSVEYNGRRLVQCGRLKGYNNFAAISDEGQR